MNRNEFLQNTSLLAAGLMFQKFSFAAMPTDFPQVRTPYDKRNFHSKVRGSSHRLTFRSKVKNEELGWLFENCFPNTLDTTVEFEIITVSQIRM